MCDTRNETISYIVRECGKPVQKEHKQRHDSVGRYVHWQFYEKLGFNRARIWYEHEPEVWLKIKISKFYGFHHTV